MEQHAKSFRPLVVGLEETHSRQKKNVMKNAVGINLYSYLEHKSILTIVRQYPLQDISLFSISECITDKDCKEKFGDVKPKCGNGVCGKFC